MQNHGSKGPRWMVVIGRSSNGQVPGSSTISVTLGKKN